MHSMFKRVRMLKTKCPNKGPRITNFDPPQKCGLKILFMKAMCSLMGKHNKNDGAI